MHNVKQNAVNNKKPTAKRSQGLKKYKIGSINVSDATYKADVAKYDMFPSDKVFITCNGVKFGRSKYDQLLKVELPCSGFAKMIVENHKIPKRTITDDDIANANHCDMLQLLVWWDETLLTKDGLLVKLKNYPHCYVIREGVFNIDTCELAPPFIAVQKFLGLNILQAYYVCDAFLKHADKGDVRDYTFLHFGVGEMPQVAPDSLNYVRENNILGVDPKGLATLFSILYDSCHISKDVILEMASRELVVVDSLYNVAFLSYDAEGNVASVFKMSRYKHSEDKFSFNHYVTQRGIGFVYCCGEAEQYDTFESLAVFDNPIELMSYLTLEREAHPLVPSISNAGCYMAMLNGNTFAISEWLTKHSEVGTLYVALSFNRVNQYIKKALTRLALEIKLPHIKEFRELLTEYAHKATIKNTYHSLRVGGWNDLINLYLDELNAVFVPLNAYEIRRYA